MTDAPGLSISPAASRMRRHRQRRRDGLRCIVIELGETEIDGPIRMKSLKAEMRNNAGAITNALYRYLDRALG